MRGDRALTAGDRTRVDALVDRMHGAENLAEFVQIVLKGLLDLIPAIDASYAEMAPANQRFVVEVRPQPPPEFMERVIARMRERVTQNPLVAHFLRTGDTRALTWDDVVDDMEEFRQSDFFRLLSEGMGIESQMAVGLPAPEGVVVGFGLNRGAEGFSDRDRSVLNALRPHLAAAHRAIRSRYEANQWRSVLTAEGWAVVLVDGNGTVTRSVPAGPEPALQIGFPLEPGEVLPSPLREAVVDVAEGYVVAEPAARRGPIRVDAAGAGFDAWVVPSPIPPHVVLVKPRGIDRSAVLALGLSPRQVDVAAALAEGGTNRQIARRLGMAEATVKKHLEHIFARLGVDNRGAAVATIRAARGPC